jgi:hypothetical protein
VGVDAENAAKPKPKPVFNLSGICVSKTAGATALSVMLLSGTVLPWKRKREAEATSVPRGVQRSHGRVSAD